LFNPSTQVSGSAGNTGTDTQTHDFGPNELINEIDIYNLFPTASVPNFKRWYFEGLNVIGSPYLFGYAGTTSPNCFFNPKGPIIGVRSYLNYYGDYCGSAFAYNTCSCTS
jgi:hypothetical protein